MHLSKQQHCQNSFDSALYTVQNNIAGQGNIQECTAHGACEVLLQYSAVKKSGCWELGVEASRWELFSKVQLSVEYPSDSVYYKTVLKYECVEEKTVKL